MNQGREDHEEADGFDVGREFPRDRRFRANRSSPTSPPAQATPGAPPAAGGPRTGKDVRAQCKADAQSQGLRGTARKGFVQDCFVKARPDLAAAQKCRQQGKEQGLADNDLKAFVRNCKTGG